MEQNEKIFANGFLFNRNEKAPDFVIGRLSLKIEEAIAFIREHNKKGWINIDIKKSKKGSYYLELDSFVPTPQTPPQSAPISLDVKDNDVDFLPF